MGSSPSTLTLVPFMKRPLALLLAALIGCSSSSSTSPQNTVNGIFVGPFARTVPSGQTDNCGSGLVQATISQNGSQVTGTFNMQNWGGYGQCPVLNTSGYVTGTVSGSTVSISLVSNAYAPNGYTLLGHIQAGSHVSVTGTFNETLLGDGLQNGTFSMTAQ
jgi:hypothetical protein